MGKMWWNYGETEYWRLERRDRERGLEESAYNEERRIWRTERMPRYLQEKNKGQKLKTIGRLRPGSEWKASRY